MQPGGSGDPGGSGGSKEPGRADETAPSGFIGRLADALSLLSLNTGWREQLKSSLILRPLLGIMDASGQAGSRAPALARTGSLLQLLAYVLSLGLFLAVGLPQFANDKIGLALIVIGALGLWVSGRMMGGRERRHIDAFDFLIIVYLGVNVIAACSSHYFLPSIKGLAKVIIYIGSYFLFTTVMQNGTRRKLPLLMAAILTGVALSFHGFYQYKIGVEPLATWEDPTIKQQGTRIFSTLGNPNLLAGFLLPLSPLALSLSAGALSLRRYFIAALALAASGIIAVATILTGSRGGYLGLFSGAGVTVLVATAWLWVNRKQVRAYLAAGLAVMTAAVCFAVMRIPSFQRRVASIFAGREHSSNSYRMNVWLSSFDMLKDNWWFGIGTGNEAFRLAYGLYMVSGYDALGTYSVPLEVGVETGILGLISFGAILACAFARAHRKFWLASAGWTRWIALGCASAITGLMVHGVVDTVFYRPQIHLLFWLLVAATITPDLDEKGDPATPPPVP